MSFVGENTGTERRLAARLQGEGMDGLLGRITRKVDAYLARRRERECRRLAAIERDMCERLKKEVVRLSYKVLVEHIKEYQRHEGAFEHKEFRDGAFIWLKNFFNPHEGERETEVRVASPQLKQTYVVIFSESVRPKYEEWCPYEAAL